MYISSRFTHIDIRIIDLTFISSRFGRSLHKFSEQLEQQKGRNSANVQILQVVMLLFSTEIDLFIIQEAFSLLAYSDPWNSPVGGQLDPAGREPVCAQLNSAILGKK